MDRVQSTAKHNYMWIPKVDDEKGNESHRVSSTNLLEKYQLSAGKCQL